MSSQGEPLSPSGPPTDEVLAIQSPFYGSLRFVHEGVEVIPFIVSVVGIPNGVDLQPLRDAQWNGSLVVHELSLTCDVAVSFTTGYEAYVFMSKWMFDPVIPTFISISVTGKVFAPLHRCSLRGNELLDTIERTFDVLIVGYEEHMTEKAPNETDFGFIRFHSWQDAARLVHIGKQRLPSGETLHFREWRTTDPDPLPISIDWPFQASKFLSRDTCQGLTRTSEVEEEKDEEILSNVSSEDEKEDKRTSFLSIFQPRESPDEAKDVQSMIQSQPTQTTRPVDEDIPESGMCHLTINFVPPYFTEESAYLNHLKELGAEQVQMLNDDHYRPHCHLKIITRKEKAISLLNSSPINILGHKLDVDIANAVSLRMSGRGFKADDIIESTRISYGPIFRITRPPTTVAIIVFHRVQDARALLKKGGLLIRGQWQTASTPVMNLSFNPFKQWAEKNEDTMNPLTSVERLMKRQVGVFPMKDPMEDERRKREEKELEDRKEKMKNEEKVSREHGKMIHGGKESTNVSGSLLQLERRRGDSRWDRGERNEKVHSSHSGERNGYYGPEEVENERMLREKAIHDEEMRRCMEDAMKWRQQQREREDEEQRRKEVESVQKMHSNRSDNVKAVRLMEEGKDAVKRGLRLEHETTERSDSDMEIANSDSDQDGRGDDGDRRRVKEATRRMNEMESVEDHERKQLEGGPSTTLDAEILRRKLEQLEKMYKGAEDSNDIAQKYEGLCEERDELDKDVATVSSPLFGKSDHFCIQRPAPQGPSICLLAPLKSALRRPGMMKERKTVRIRVQPDVRLIEPRERQGEADEVNMILAMGPFPHNFPHSSLGHFLEKFDAKIVGIFPSSLPFSYAKVVTNSRFKRTMLLSTRRHNVDGVIMDVGVYRSCIMNVPNRKLAKEEIWDFFHKNVGRVVFISERREEHEGTAQYTITFMHQIHARQAVELGRYMIRGVIVNIVEAREAE